MAHNWQITVIYGIKGYHMGMFDQLHCRYELPIAGANEILFQSQDTPSQSLDCYEIREDGSLWHQEYDLDHTDSDASSRLCARVNFRWTPCHFTGSITFHGSSNTTERQGRFEFAAFFLKGRLTALAQINESA